MDRRKSIRRGFSLVESAIVLGVVGLVVAGIWKATGPVRAKQQLDQTVNDVIGIVSNTRWFFLGNVVGFCQSIGCTPNINVTRMFVHAGLAPDYHLTTFDTNLFPYSDTNDALQTPMGYKVFLQAGDWGVYGNIYGLKIATVFVGLEKSVCINLIEAVASRFKDDTDLVWVETQAGGGVHSFPITLDEAATLCAPSGDGKNFLEFFFDAY